MRYRPNPDSRLDAHQWNGNLEKDIPKRWRDRAATFGSKFTEADDGTLNVPTPFGYADCERGWHVGMDEAGGFYVLTPAVLGRRWIPEDAA